MFVCARECLPAKAEKSEVQSQQSGHHMPDEGAGLSGVQVETEPEGCEQGKQLTHHKVHLKSEEKGELGTLWGLGLERLKGES